ncbi:MAG: TetR family transcriptional regulator [Myxococcaceae bacterium]|jgi:AcrR family transcriptional regulator|nr:TetR family transcriptional regulator [Myxococcaceae bacterium]
MTAPTLRARFKEATSTAILDAAEQVAAEGGLPAASLQTIAQSAGVAVGTIYNHFEDRDALFAALFARRRAELLATLDTSMKTDASFAAQLDAFVRTVFTYFDARRTFLRLALESENFRPPPVRKPDGRTEPAMQQLLLRAERVVRAGVREKRLRSEAADLAALVLVSIVKAVLHARLHGPKTFVGETEGVISLFLQGAGK